MLKDYDHGFKVIIAGSSGVGKSSVLLRFVDNIYSTNLLSTIGVDFKFKTIDVNGQKIKMQIWDTAGSQNFRSIVSAYYRGADAVVLVYSIDDRNSFQEIESYWINQVNQYRQPTCEIMLIANKVDLDTSQVSASDTSAFIKRHNISLFREVSAKTGSQIGDAFRALGERMLAKDRKKGKEEGGRVPLGVMSHPDSPQRAQGGGGGGGCCG